MNQLAQELNTVLQNQAPACFRLLSSKGKTIFFPKAGILGQTAQAKGKKFNATIGIALEDDGSPMRLASIDDSIKLDAKDVYPYAPSYGKSELRKKWQEMILEKNPSCQKNISLPVVANALTHALTVVGTMFLDPDEQLIVADKYWGNYKLMFHHGCDASITTFNTYANGGLDVDSFKEVLSSSVGKKVVLLNFPNNPSGYTPTVEEAHAIAEIIKDRAEVGDDIVVMLDDAYFGLVYEDGVYTESLFSLLGDLHENVLAVKIDGATKEDYAWGFRVGFITYAQKGLSREAAEALEDKTAGIVRGSISNACHLSQSILLQAYTNSSYQSEKQQKYDVLQARYSKVKEVLSLDIHKQYYTPLPFNSGYFMCVELQDGIDGEELRLLLLEQYDTGVIAVGNLIRVAYSCLEQSTIEPFFENITNACKQLAT